MARCILLFLMLVMGSAAFAQTSLSGKVTEEGGEPVLFGNVVLFQNGVQKTGVQTDFDGNFNFANIDPGTYDVEVSYIGFPTKRINGVVVKAGQITPLNVILGGDGGVKLDEIVVVEYKVPLIEMDNTTQGQTVTAQEIVNLPTKSIQGIAATTAGVSSADEGDGLSIRGSRDNATDYYIDGVRVRGSVIPTMEIEQVQILTGGVPANFGDVTGGVVSITTKGPSSKFGGGLEVETSQFLDPYEYNLAAFNVSGPILKKKTDDGLERSLIGFRLNGQYRSRGDRDPSAVGVYKIKDEKLAELKANPVDIFPGSSVPAPNARYLVDDDVELVKAQPNYGDARYDIGAKLDFQLTNAIDVTIGGTGNYVDQKNIVGAASQTLSNDRLLNFENNPTEQRLEYRGFARFRHRIGAPPEEGEKQLIQNAMYTLQVGYDRNQRNIFDARHEDRLFDYGYIGKFDQNRDAINVETRVVPDTAGNPIIFYAHTGYVQELTGYAPNRDINGGITAYNDDITDFTSLNDFPVINGQFSNSVFDIYDMHRNVNSLYNIYYERDQNQLSFNADASFDLILGSSDKGRHSIQFGLMYEQRQDRFYQVRPRGLWEVARLAANSHFDGLDSLNVLRTEERAHPFFPDSMLTFEVYDFLAKDDVWASANGAESQQTSFDRNLRQKLGLSRTDWINVDGLSPGDLSLDLFAASEIDQQIIDYYGYDYLGNPISGDVTFDDFFNERDANGKRTLPVGPLQPIYTAAFIQDKFSFKDIIFRVGLRVDRYDANTKVLKDPYSLYETFSASEFDALPERANNAKRPETIGEDFVVYVQDPDLSNKELWSVTAYRDGDVWYNPSGTRVNDPVSIFGGTAAKPALVRGTSENIRSEEYDPSTSFTDYEPELNFMPRLAFSFPISDEASFFAHYDVLVQRPPGSTIATALDYFYFQERSNDVATFGLFNNPDLRSEKTVDYEVGFQQKLTNSSALKVSAYYKELRDMIQRKRFFFAYPAEYVSFGNEDFATVKGFAFTYDLRRTKNVKLVANYTLQFADGTGSGAESQRGLSTRGNLRTIYPLSFDERHNFALTVDYRYGSGNKYDGPKWFGRDVFANAGINLQALAASGRPFTAKSDPAERDGEKTQGQINGSRLPWNYRLNLRIDKDFSFGKKLNLNVYFRVQNILNTANVLRVYPYSQSAADDGYLQSSRGRDDVASQGDLGPFFATSYQWRLLNPTFYSLPRRIFIGALFDF